MPTGLLIGAAIIGIGATAYGTVKQTQAAKQQAQYQQDMIAQQQKQEAIRQQAMELDARRRSTEVLRNQQRARALALATATNQGAGQGSGLQGAYGQISGQGNTNLLGISQQLGFGQQTFASNQLLSQARIGYAGAQADYMAGQGLSSLGGSIISAAGQISNIGGNYFGGARAAGGGMVGPAAGGYYSK